jgi:hypothetical protein
MREHHSALHPHRNGLALDTLATCYPPIKKLRNAVLSKRGKRRLIVAAARRLQIDLWRLATGRASAQELGLQLSTPMTVKSDTDLGTARVRVLSWALK